MPLTRTYAIDLSQCQRTENRNVCSATWSRNITCDCSLLFTALRGEVYRFSETVEEM